MPVHSPQSGGSVRALRFDPPPTGYEIRRIVLSLAVAAMGLIDVLSALLSRLPERLLVLRRLVPTEILDTSRTFTLLAGALLLVTAWGLRRGKRRAFVTAMLLCAVSVPVNMLKALDVEEATVATALMYFLGVSADAFRVQSRELSFAMLRSRAMWAILALCVYIVAGSWVAGAVFGVEPSVWLAFRDAGYRMFGIGDPVVLVPQPLPHAQQRALAWYLTSLPVLSLAVVVGLAIASLRPARHRSRHRAEAGLVRQLMRQHGDSSVAWFALADDTDYFFSRNGRAVIPYRFESDVLLAIGDPIGPPEELPTLLREFEAHCRTRDWRFAFFQARPEHLPMYRDLGWRALHIGEDPTIATAGFSLEGGAIGQVRRQIRKAEQLGITVRHFFPDREPLDPAHAPPGWLEQMRAVSHEWARGRHGGERGFCMGRFDTTHLREVWVSVAWNGPAQRIEAFVTWVPVPARRGWALDLTRRRRDAPLGTMELLVVRSVEAARERGDALVSLSLSALAKVDEPPPVAATGPAGAEPDRAREFLMQHLARFYDFKGLFQWKKKFDPVFEDRFLVYPEPFALPAVTLALVRAQSPGGLWEYLRGWLPRRPEKPEPPEAEPPAAEAAAG
jgi:phosphatidylglycerol lysyltransferase